MQEPCPEWVIETIKQLQADNPYIEKCDGEFRCGYDDALTQLLEKLGVGT